MLSSFLNSLFFLNISFDKFFLDIDELMRGSLTPQELVIYAMAAVIAFLTVATGSMGIVKFVEYINSRPKEPIPQQEPEEIRSEQKTEIDIGEFGKIVSETKVAVKGEQLDYFILKKSKYEKDTLPIGTIVIILKRNNKEAHVKAAGEKDIKKLASKGIKL